MSEFKKYQHVGRYDTKECAGLLEGLCYIFPKLDGTNASIYRDGDVVKTGSRTRELSASSDNAGFDAYVNGSGREKYEKFFRNFPNHRLYGEWLVPHTIKGYRDEAWRKFYVFDIVDGGGNYVPYDQYTNILNVIGIEYVPAIAVIQEPTPDRLVKLAKSNTYLMKDGEGAGEGIVIKRYDFVNRHGRIIWGKLVLNEFKDKMAKSIEGGRRIQETKSSAEKIVESYVTKSLVDKELAKLFLIEEKMEKKRLIPNLFNNVYDDLMDNMKNISMEFNRPTIDLKQLHYHMCQKIREFLPIIFS